MKKITIETMKDLKVALNLVPDDVLSSFSCGCCEGGIIGCTDGGEEGDEIKMMKSYRRYTKKYPALRKIIQYMEAVNESDGEDVISV